MPNKMLIDATHPEETRVVVLRGNRVEEFDFESANRKQLRGNIYLAKVTRVEPSLQAAFVDYGGNRHGFLAFSEIHPDYYQIPVADRQALIAEEERAQRAAEAEADQRAGRRQSRRELSSERRAAIRSERLDDDETIVMAAGSEQLAPPAGLPEESGAEPHEAANEPSFADQDEASAAPAGEAAVEPADLESSRVPESGSAADEPPLDDPNNAVGSLAAQLGVPEPPMGQTVGTPASIEAVDVEVGDATGPVGNITEVNDDDAEGEEEVIESVGGADALEELPERTPRVRRQYKIQEVIKRRQVMLVQVVKEERGTKGAALTTYLSLAGRYSVLMPNTARGGGISRKITSAEDRRRLKDIAQELEVPEGMGVILRTAGATRTKAEVKRDFEYLMRLWETVRDFTLKSTAPTLVYEEGSLVKRSIRDLYNKDIEEIIVAGEEAHQEARDFMRMLMPSHVKNVKSYRDSLPIFTRYGIESQLDAMFTPVMQLRSGGYIVLNQAEALVAIDVNSGRATREHHIEDTALKTNLEAAEEIARQLRLRDLAGLIVIDFIDMDEKRNNRSVERRLKECLRHDRARIQVGHISHFGLLEMSRQRIRSSVLESSTEKCSHCGGTGHVRSVSSVALQLLRSLEEMLLKGATHNLTVRTRTEIALYLLNNKRAHLRALEERFRIVIMVNADATVGGQLSFVIEKGEQVHTLEQARALAQQQPVGAPAMIEEEEEDEEEDRGDEVDSVDSEDTEPWIDEAQPEGEPIQEPSRGRRRRGRRGRDPRPRTAYPAGGHAPAPQPVTEFPDTPREHDDEDAEDMHGSGNGAALSQPQEENGDANRRRRRRGRRGGRRNRRGREGEPQTASESGGHEAEPVHIGADFETASPAEDDRQPRQVPIMESHVDAPAPAVEPRELPPAEAMPEHEPASQAVSTPAAANDAEPPAPEPPRRRSTVREPAPAASHGVSESPPALVNSPSAEPVIISPADSESSDRPRRSGWWSRRALGKG